MASSAGILMYRRTGPRLEVLLVHPGGPFWRNKDDGAWSIPKGEMDENEDVAAAARREFLEETGCALSGPLEPLGEVRQRGGKRGAHCPSCNANNAFRFEPPRLQRLRRVRRMLHCLPHRYELSNRFRSAPVRFFQHPLQMPCILLSV